MDGWLNSDHPTETVPGDAGTLPAGANPNAADLDYTDTLSPAHHTLLTGEEKMTIARWIDLGSPIDFGTEPWHGWFLDDLRPTLTVSAPRRDVAPNTVDEIRIGMADANSGIDSASFSVTANVAVAGRTAGSELADLFVDLGDGVFQLSFQQPLEGAPGSKLFVSIADMQGNITRVERTFGVPGGVFSDGFESGSASAWSTSTQ